MVLQLEIPDSYGYVFLSCGVLPAVTNFFIGAKVIMARKKYKIPLPNLYATPGFHDKADEFNRVQRGHQHILENISDFRAVSFIGGLAHPIICATCGVLYCLGNYLYMAGYSDTSLDVKSARLKKGGPLNVLSCFVALVCAGKYSYSLIIE